MKFKRNGSHCVRYSSSCSCIISTRCLTGYKASCVCVYISTSVLNYIHFLTPTEVSGDEAFHIRDPPSATGWECSDFHQPTHNNYFHTVLIGLWEEEKKEKKESESFYFYNWDDTVVSRDLLIDLYSELSAMVYKHKLCLFKLPLLDLCLLLSSKCWIF